MQVRITNTNPVDVVVDIKGENQIQDKIIIHPKTKVTVDVSNNALSAIKSTNGLVVQNLGGQ